MTRPRVGERRRREVRRLAILVLSRTRLITMMDWLSVLVGFLVGALLLVRLGCDGWWAGGWVLIGCWGMGRWR